MSEEFMKELESLVKKSDWYVEVHSEMKKLIEKYNKTDSLDEKDNLTAQRDAFIFKLANLLEDGKVKLGDSNEFHFDSKRAPIDTIVIHHSSRPAETPIPIINAIHLLNLYVPEFSNKTRSYFGQAIFSGHLKKGEQTFIAYHYLIMPDGKVIQNLKDQYVGWHCGNWDYNCRSIAICFHAELEESEPTEAAVRSARRLISQYNPKEILGHREISQATICPGNNFLGTNGWKQKLVEN